MWRHCHFTAQNSVLFNPWAWWSHRDSNNGQNGQAQIRKWEKFGKQFKNIFWLRQRFRYFRRFEALANSLRKDPFMIFLTELTVNDWCCKRDFFCKSVSISCALFSQDQFLRSSGPVYLFKKDWNLMNTHTHTHTHTNLSLTDHLLPHKLFDRESERERESVPSRKTHFAFVPTVAERQ